ncbi:DUF4082 domain-containing protein [Nocardioides sp. dk4132]|uniref:DUF4082 domain-containing protein n=1 Tax=unclassified Nocardioides TaxID=2615069 RepID=UPI00129707B8|nr:MULTISPECIES: DUF4082 domain-containing protein [unclassified Nocardioides]MQW74796.1 DUF4082 domain-containing protein [Nocardioides sp. dk4132]QGA06688.1 DUF4082 domain-containing protein [Nocardioides sp. dk884]
MFSISHHRRLPLAMVVVCTAVALSGATPPATAGAATAAPSGYSVWPDSLVPQTPVDGDTTRTTLGLEFSAAAAGRVTAIEVYRGPGGAVPQDATLWSPGGRALAVADVADPQGTGWLVAELSEPVTLTPGRRYVASYTAPEGRYAGDNDALSAPVVHDALTAWRGVFTRGEGRPDQTYRQSNYYVDVVFEPTDERVPAPGGEPTPSPSPGGDFPDAASTGVPVGTALTPYTGPCTITQDGTVIEARTVDCDLLVRASGVVIRNTLINGTVTNDELVPGNDFTITDSEVRAGDYTGTGIGTRDFVATRVEVTGGNRSINCWLDCEVRSSFVHGQMSDETGVSHESGIRMGAGNTIVGNTITCDAPYIPPDAGCSAGLTGYGDFAAVRDVLVQGNLFLASTGGTCAYGGSSAGKPFSLLARDIRFIDNVFQRGETGNCGVWAPVMDFDAAAPGNVWSGNTWEDGTPVTP